MVNLFKVLFQKFMEVAPALTLPHAHYIMNPGKFGTQTYS